MALARRRSGWAALPLVVLTGGLGLALMDLRDEFDCYRLRQARIVQQAGESPDPVVLEDVGRALPAQGVLIRGLLRAAAAVDAGRATVQGDGLLTAAQEDIAQATAARPSWAEADVAQAYVALLRGQSPSAIAALERSYRAAAFLPQSASWRIRYGVSVWSRLSPEAQDHIVSETIWLARSTPRSYAFAQLLVEGTPAEPLVRTGMAAVGSGADSVS